jgi:DNA-binding SARP family transcriptional activator
MLERRAGSDRVLRLRLLGPPRLSVDDETATLANRKLICLLGYLALAPGRRESRERLVGLLWSESDERRARGSLRQALAAFRRICGELGFSGFETDRGHCALSQSEAVTDVEEVLSALGPGPVHPALLELDDLPETLMQGCEDVDPAFRNWLTVQREGLRERLLRGLSAGLDAAEATGADGEPAAAAILRLDPTQERAVRHLMRVRARAGDAGGALAAYNRLWQVLDEAHDMEPSPETVALVAGIKRGELAPAPPAPPARQRAPLLIVEPFGLEPEGERARMRLDGFRRRLVANLVRFREWRVTEALDGDPPELRGPEGRGRFRLRAEAEPEGPGEDAALGVTLTLSEEAEGVFVWSDRFRLDLQTWVPAQARLLRQVTTALNVNLSAERLRRLAATPRLDQSLHDRWLLGQDLITDYHPDSWTRARRLFLEITRAAPDFAPAWSSLVQLDHTLHVAHPGVMRSVARHWRTLEMAQRAAALDPLDSRAQATLGWALIFCGRWDAADISLDLALQRNDHDPWTVTSVAAARAFAGHGAEVERLAHSVLETAETSETRRWSLLAGLRFIRGDDEGALEAAGRAGRVRANIGAWRAAALWHLGREAEARAAAEALQADLRRRWRGPGPCTPEAMSRWLLSMFPMRREVDWRRFRDGLRGAGMPVDRAPFGWVAS